jgi:hypothetical protein
VATSGQGVSETLKDVAKTVLAELKKGSHVPKALAGSSWSVLELYLS